MLTVYKLYKRSIRMKRTGTVVDIQVAIANLKSMGYVVEPSEYNEGIFFAKKSGSDYWEYVIKP